MMKPIFFTFLLLAQISWSQSPLERLENSPRHHEWVNLDPSGSKIQSFLVYPEVSEKVPLVILIHENRGLNDWARSMADQIAEMGYITLAPDFLSGKAPNGGGTNDFENSDAARTAIYALNSEEISNTLIAAVDLAKKNPAANGKVVVIGFCWGGSQSFEFATLNPSIQAAIVCYGTGPEDDEVYKNIRIPVYGFYGGNDNRVNATIDKSKAAMKDNNTLFETEIYQGAGHGFFRAGEDPNASEANKIAREEGIKRLKEILSQL